MTTRPFHLAAALCSFSIVLLTACSNDCPNGQCSGSSSELREITTAEAVADFDEMAESFRSLYGALHRKEQRYNFQFETLVSQYRNQVMSARSEAEDRRLFQKFVGEFHDPHISLSADLIPDVAHAFRLPFLVMPVENTYVVYSVSASLGANPPIQVGDELLDVDGNLPSDLAASFAPYAGAANPLTVGHFASLNITYRPMYLTDGMKSGDVASVTVRGAAGDVRTMSLPWTELSRLLPVAAPPVVGQSSLGAVSMMSAPAAEVATAELTKFGARVPFFMTDKVRAMLGVQAEVTPSAAALAKFNLSAEAAQQVNYFAITYQTGGKNVLLVRLPDYEPANASDALNYLRALLDEQRSKVDALVLDETHNPGGNLTFALDVAKLLAPQAFNTYVQKMHADRLWIQTFAQWAQDVSQQDPNDPLANAFLSRAQLIDEAYSAGQSLSAPIPMYFDGMVESPDAAHWTKPALVLTDELSVSCADVVPALAKANHMATLFGQTTMGGGGNVEQVATLTNTQAQLMLSRGLGTVYDPSGLYPDARFIEDNGVTPDSVYSHTLADFRAGYVGYVYAFNTALLRQLGTVPH